MKNEIVKCTDLIVKFNDNKKGVIYTFRVNNNEVIEIFNLVDFILKSNSDIKSDAYISKEHYISRENCNTKDEIYNCLIGKISDIKSQDKALKLTK